MFHSNLDILQKTSFWAHFNSSYDIILSYLVKNSIQRNMNMWDIYTSKISWCICTPVGRVLNRRTRAWYKNAKSNLTFTPDNLDYIWKIDGKGYICLEDQAFLTLNFQQWFMQTPCHFSPLLIVEFRSICQRLALPGQIHRWIHNGI